MTKQEVIKTYPYIKNNLIQIEREEFYQELYLLDKESEETILSFDNFINKINIFPIKLLILGNEGSGKTTFLEQLMYKWGKSSDEKSLFTTIKNLYYIDLRDFSEFNSISEHIEELIGISRDEQKTQSKYNFYLFDNFNTLSNDLKETFCAEIKSHRYKNYIVNTRVNDTYISRLNVIKTYYLQGFSYYYTDSENLTNNFHSYAKRISKKDLDNFKQKEPLVKHLFQYPHWFVSLCHFYEKIEDKQELFKKVVNEILPNERDIEILGELAYEQVNGKYTKEVKENIELLQADIVIKNEDNYKFVNDFFLYYFLAKYMEDNNRAIKSCLQSIENNEFEIYDFICNIIVDEHSKEIFISQVQKLLTQNTKLISNLSKDSSLYQYYKDDPFVSSFLKKEFCNKDLLNKIDRSQSINILLIAPIEYGKSDLLKYLREDLESDSYQVKQFNLKLDPTFTKVKEHIREEQETYVEKKVKLCLLLENIEYVEKTQLEAFLAHVNFHDFRKPRAIFMTSKLGNKFLLPKGFSSYLMKPCSREFIEERVYKDLITKSNVSNISEDMREKIILSLMYISAGHPKVLEKCYEMIDYENLDELFTGNFLSTYILDEINKMKISDEMKIVSELSPLRKTNHKIHEELLKRGLINYSGTIYKFKKDLIKTKIFIEDDSFLQDYNNVVRQIFFIEMRLNHREKSLKIIKTAKNIFRYELELASSEPDYLVIVAIEYLFLCLEEFSIQSKTENIADYTTDWIDFILNTIESIKLKNEFFKKLEDDKEIKFLMNYFYNSSEERYKDYYDEFLGDIQERMKLCSIK